MQALVHSENPVCRETALLVLRALGSTSLRTQLEALANDPVERVSRYARHVLGSVA